MKKKLAVKKKGTNKVLYYIYGEYVAEAVAEQYCMSLKKRYQLPRDYLQWLMRNKKKFTIIDIVDTNSLLPYKTQDIRVLWGQLQYILFGEER
jgi:hypothetical protein|nr:MAG TPA: hypothetical protein [Caudoviricetes sp.]